MTIFEVLESFYGVFRVWYFLFVKIEERKIDNIGRQKLTQIYAQIIAQIKFKIFYLIIIYFCNKRKLLLVFFCNCEA